MKREVSVLRYIDRVERGQRAAPTHGDPVVAGLLAYMQTTEGHAITVNDLFDFTMTLMETLRR